eukprot:CAMPEP_0179231904 /NCGR_PEP_ID=MMETSP0797-20121207/11583_1 /TAXON_ID=47934 /ORGANISM="Dinophysis acuminata, Strain DAEP01" /LENGTH=186 /DNA_ID=CAMNT_0020939005 /DNA_START=255 /DNA_END=811 /DNA_ORIENTATION=+
MEHLDDAVERRAHLLLADDQRGCEADDVVVRLLREDPRVAHVEAELPGRDLLHEGRVDEDRVQEALAADALDPGEATDVLLELPPEELAEPGGVVRELLVDQDLERLHRDAARDGAPAESAPVRPGLQREHDFVVSEHGADGHQAAGQRLPKDHHVRPDAAVLHAEHLPGPAEPGLHLVGAEEDVV